MTTLTDILERYYSQMLMTSYPPKILKEALDDIEAYYTQRFETAIGEDEPKVIKRKGFYPPYQPQVEQHRRSGRNELRTQARKKWQLYPAAEQAAESIGEQLKQQGETL